MIINITRDKGNLRVNSDFASAVPEFAELLNDDTLGVPALAFVVYTLDEAEDNIWANLPESIRKNEVLDSLKLSAELPKNPKVVAAMKKYKSFVQENVGYRFKSAYNDGMKKISEYVKAKKGLTDEDAKEFSAVMKEMPVILKGKGEIDKIGVKEQSKGSIRGGKTLTINERM